MALASEIENKQVEIHPLPCDDAWMRDTAPTFVVDQGRKDVRGVDWTFNGWGHGTLLVHEYKEDAKVAGAVCEMLGCKKYSSDLVCEGGALAYDGEGTVITTESVLLDEKRNGGKKTKDEIQQILLSNLGAEKVIWLPRGLYGDDEKNTNGHIDNLVAFVAPAVVVLAWTDDETDPQFQRSKMAEDILKSSTDAKGRKFTIHRYSMSCNLGNCFCCMIPEDQHEETLYVCSIGNLMLNVLIVMLNWHQMFIADTLGPSLMQISAIGANS